MSSAALPDLRGDGMARYIVREDTKEMSQRLARSLLVGTEPCEAAVLENTFGEDRLVFVSSHRNGFLIFKASAAAMIGDTDARRKLWPSKSSLSSPASTISLLCLLPA